MKTTFDLPSPLIDELKRHAAEEGRPARSLVEEALRRLLDERDSRARPGFTLPDASVDGAGLSVEYAGADWATIRDAAYGLDA